MRIASAFIVILAISFALGCSGSGANTVLPDNIPNAPEAQHGNALCLGIWEVAVNTATSEIEVCRTKAADGMLNVLGFLEPPAMSNLAIDFGSLVIDQPVLEVDVKLTHPLPDDVFTGFDVRGIVFGPEVVNADGYSPVMRPTTFSGVPFGYQNGLLGTPHSYAQYSGAIFGYKYFCDDLGADDDLAEFFSDEDNLANRGVFSSGVTNRRHYILSWENKVHPIDFLVFNYAVYANFDWPSGDPPYALDDFAITTANSREAFCMKATEVENTLNYYGGVGGGYITLDVEVWDWQGFSDYDVTIIADPQLGPDALDYDSDSPGSTSKSHVFSFTHVTGPITSSDDIPITITAFDNTETFGSAWFLGLLPSSNGLYHSPVFNAWVYTVSVNECPEPEVTSIVPDNGWGGAINDAVITGSFIDGPDLAVTLTKSGESDIICTDVTFVNSTTITCDIDIAVAVGGFWNVVVTNGCGTPGTLPDGFEIHQSKNIPIRTGVTPRDIAVDHGDGDLLIIYSDGQVWRYTEAGYYQDGALFYNSSALANRIDISPNGASMVGGGSGGSCYLYSFSDTGAALYSHSCPDFVAECVGYTSSTYLDYHAAFKGWSTTAYDYWYDRHAPPTYSGGSGNIYHDASGTGGILSDSFIALECSTLDNLYCLEGAPEYRVEMKSLTCGSSTSYTNWGGVQSDGMNGFNDPKDITRDNNNNYYILDLLTTSSPLVKKYTLNGSQVGSFGDSTSISGTPLRIEGSDYNGNMFVLHDNGISLFFPSEIP